MTLSAARPEYLLLALLLAPIFFLHHRTYTALSPWRRRTSLTLRLAVLTLLVAAAAGVGSVRTSTDKYVVYALDVSRSVSPDELGILKDDIAAEIRAASPNDRSGVIFFGGEATLVKSANGAVEVDANVEVNPERTNIGGALRLAAASAPAGYGLRVVLATDGAENSGDGLPAAADLLARGAEIDVLRIPAARRADVSLEAIDLPQTVGFEQPFQARLVIHSDEPQILQIRVARDHRAEASYRYAHPGGGARAVAVRLEADRRGYLYYEFDVSGETDARLENNRQARFVRVAGPPQILFVANGPEEVHAPAEVLAEAGYSVHRVASSGFPRSAGELQPFDAVILVNVPAHELSQKKMETLRAYVAAGGGGLGMIGGPESFGAGGYYKTPVEEVLPVTMDVRNRKEWPMSALVLSIDKSGSMGEELGGYNKLDLAKQAAVLSAELMNSMDYIGVIAFDGEAKEVVRFGRMDSVERVREEIATLRPGGGTNIMPSLEMAHDWLRTVPAMNKHVILLSDGISADGDYPGRCAGMRSDGITLSAVSIGPGSNTELMERIASAGGGRSYVSENAGDIPRIFTREAMLTVRNVVAEETFEPTARQHPLLDGLDLNRLPSLEGYVLASVKPQAELLMEGPDGDPLLAITRSGLGKTLAWTSDMAPRWGRRWISWSAFPQFWEQTARWLVPEAIRDDLACTVRDEGGTFEIAVDARDESGRPSAFRELRARAISPDGSIIEAPMEQLAPGRYVARIESLRSGQHLLTVVDATGAEPRLLIRTGIGQSYPPEYRVDADGGDLIARLRHHDGVREVENFAEASRPLAKPIETSREFGRPLILVAALLFVLDVAIRRVQFALAGIWRRETARKSNPFASRLAAARDRARSTFRQPLITPSKETSTAPPVAQREPESHEQTVGNSPKDTMSGPSHTQRLLDAKRRAKKS